MTNLVGLRYWPKPARRAQHESRCRNAVRQRHCLRIMLKRKGWKMRAYPPALPVADFSASYDGGLLNSRMPLVLLVLLIGLPAQAATHHVDTQTVNYRAGDTDMRGHLAYDGEQEQSRPGVLVVPEWWGLNDYARRRARDLAALGYVALAVDMYGGGKATIDPEQAGAWAGEIGKDPEMARARFEGS